MATIHPSPRLLCAAVCCLMLPAMAAPLSAKEKTSGFLSDDSGLEKEKDPAGRTRRVWISPRLTATNDHKVILAPVAFYPGPKPTEAVPQKTLDDILHYIDTRLGAAVRAAIPMVDDPGPGVIRARMAITAVAEKKGLKPYEYIPVAMIAAGAKEAAGVRKHDVELFVEAEIIDSVTGEPLARGVRRTEEVKRAGRKDVLTLDDFKTEIDAWGKTLQRIITMRMHSGAN